MKLWKFCIPPDQEVVIKGFAYTNCLAVVVAQSEHEAKALIRAHPSFKDDVQEMADEFGSLVPSSNAWIDRVTPQEIDLHEAAVVATARIGW